MFARVTFKIVHPGVIRSVIRIEPMDRFYINLHKVSSIRVFETPDELSKELHGTYNPPGCEFPIYTVNNIWILDVEDVKRLINV